MQKTILITGVNGFIGSHAASHLIKKHRVIGIGTSDQPVIDTLGDYKKMILPDSSLSDYLQAQKPDAVLHCAGQGSVPLSVENPEADFMAGPQLVMHVLDSLRRSKIRSTFIFPSSAAVYGNPETLPVSEEAPLRPISPYGFHKVISENILREYYELYDQPYLCMRIFSCYGEGLKKQLLWDAAVKAGHGGLQLFGTGGETRDFIHVNDLAGIVSLLITNEITNTTLNVANGVQISVREIIETLMSSLNLDVPIHFNQEQREGDPLFWEADISRLSKLGFISKVPLQDGVRRFAKWYLKQNIK